MTLTPEPLRGDVLQQSKWDAEERYQKVADGQRADENICGSLDPALSQDNIDNQTIANESQEKNHRVHNNKRSFGADR